MTVVSVLILILSINISSSLRPLTKGDGYMFKAKNASHLKNSIKN